MNDKKIQDADFENTESLILHGETIEKLDLANMEEEELGFLPYWEPGIVCNECGEKVPHIYDRCQKHKDAGVHGNAFYAIPVSVETREGSPDPRTGEINDWNQYVMQAAVDMPGAGRKGPKDNAETLDIMAGDLFMVNMSAGLNLRRFFGLPVHIKAVGLLKGKHRERSPMVVYEAHVTPEVKKELNRRKQEEAKALLASRGVNGGRAMLKDGTPEAKRLQG
jgi:hypothetical protein